MEKVCKQCGLKKPINEFYKEANSRGGHRSNCKLCKNKKTEEWKLRNIKRVLTNRREYQRTDLARFRSGKGSAKRRSIPFNLSFSYYKKIANKPCTYCQNKLGEVGFGLDRVDSAKGYIKNNVVPCCGICNFLKMQKDANPAQMIDQLERTLAGLKRRFA